MTLKERVLEEMARLEALHELGPNLDPDEEMFIASRRRAVRATTPAIFEPTEESYPISPDDARGVIL